MTYQRNVKVKQKKPKVLLGQFRRTGLLQLPQHSAPYCTFSATCNSPPSKPPLWPHQPRVPVTFSPVPSRFLQGQHPPTRLPALRSTTPVYAALAKLQHLSTLLANTIFNVHFKRERAHELLNNSTSKCTREGPHPAPICSGPWCKREVCSV